MLFTAFTALYMQMKKRKKSGNSCEVVKAKKNRRKIIYFEGKYIYYYFFLFFSFHSAIHTFFLHFSRHFASFFPGSPGPFTLFFVNHSTSRYIFAAGLTEESYST